MAPHERSGVHVGHNSICCGSSRPYVAARGISPYTGPSTPGPPPSRNTCNKDGKRAGPETVFRGSTHTRGRLVAPRKDLWPDGSPYVCRARCTLFRTAAARRVACYELDILIRSLVRRMFRIFGRPFGAITAIVKPPRPSQTSQNTFVMNAASHASS